MIAPRAACFGCKPGSGSERQHPITRLDDLRLVSAVIFRGARKEPKRNAEDDEHDEAQLHGMGVRRYEMRIRELIQEFSLDDEITAQQQAENEKSDAGFDEASYGCEHWLCRPFLMHLPQRRRVAELSRRQLARG